MIPITSHASHELLCEEPSTDDISHWLRPIGFADCVGAYRRLRRISERSGATQALVDLMPSLLTVLAEAPNPDRVLINLERFLQSTPSMRDQLIWLAENLRATDILVRLFAGSQFLTEILLRNPEYVSLLVDHPHLPSARPLELSSQLTYLDNLRRFQRSELLRIGACDLLDLLDLPAITAQLSTLADRLIQACLVSAAGKAPPPEDGRLAGFVVLALGKLGGFELNYSSDIDLLFLAEDVADVHRQLGERLIEGLTQVTPEGFLYRVDMRLRPWGRSGPLVTSLDGYLTYLRDHARVWEKQALLKARVVAGNIALGERFLAEARPIILDVSDAIARESVRTMKQLTESHLRRRGQTWGEVKLGEGSIRDIEFVAQYLQLVYGAEHPAVCTSNTLDALQRLSAHGYLAQRDARILTDGYIFLRTIEHYLQMMHYRQTHALPEDLTSLTQLAQRLGFTGRSAGQLFINRYEEHRAAIRAVYLKFLGEQLMNDETTTTQANGASRAHIARMGTDYTSVFTPQEIRRHALLAARLGDAPARDDGRLIEVEATALDDERWRVTIVGFDQPGELSLICGLLFVYGFSIEEGQVFTYEAKREGVTERPHTEHRKIVDVFTVRAVHAEADDATWRAYADELTGLLRRTPDGQAQAAHGALANRVAAAIATNLEGEPTLTPVDIRIDNETSERYTVLHITAPDTLGFLYELTNALAYSRIYIGRVSVESFGERAHDTLFVTDTNGRKIVSPEKQRELRAAVALTKHFTHLLPRTPDPETALLHFREFIDQLFRQPDWPGELASLENPEVLNNLAHLLGVSEFLWDDFLRMQYANLFPVVRDADALATQKTRRQLQGDLETALAVVHAGPQSPTDESAWADTLNDFKDREMFRIDMRHILGHTKEFWDFSEELTALAEVVVNATYHLCHEDLRTRYGTPYLESGEVSEMSVCALGKCGGHELGFASDIELMFIYSGNGRTAGPHVITTAEFYEKLVQMFLQVIRAKRAGIFEIDLQLRPYGKAGTMAVSLEAFRRYFTPDGPAWAYERQALVKLRPIAGNSGLGETIVAQRDDHVYRAGAFDVAAMRAMRERQIRHLVTGGTFNAKYSPGGLVDVEYLVQGLQILHGGEHSSLRATNIREAMLALAQLGLLPKEAYDQLRRAHTFLRWLIDGLRMVRGDAKDLTVPPVGTAAFAFLARRLRYGQDVHRLSEDLNQFSGSVQTLNRRLLGA